MNRDEGKDIRQKAVVGCDCLPAGLQACCELSLVLRPHAVAESRLNREQASIPPPAEAWYLERLAGKAEAEVVTRGKLIAESPRHSLSAIACVLCFNGPENKTGRRRIIT